ncbi:MAG TPA: hypothetical protein VF290_22310 [Pyrinomonadaceae bacterium]
MTTICRVLLFLALVVTVKAQTSAPADVHIKLSFAENKTVYRIGEPIKVVMEFTADREGYIVEFLPDRSEMGSDTVILSPETGATNWIDELHDNHPYYRDVLSTEKLTSTPKRVELTLNDKLRFDSPGRYTIYVKTRRVSPASGRHDGEPFLSSTNSISFEVQSMSDADEAKEVKRLSDLLDAKRDINTDEEVTKLLSYLTGDPSTREKVRRFFLLEQRSGNYQEHIFKGLFIARNRALVVKLIENNLRDPAIPVTASMLYAATKLKTLLMHGLREKVDAKKAMLEPAESPQSREIREAYVVELAASLAKRTGDNQITTAVTIFTSVEPEPRVDTPGRREARRILVQQFDSLHPYTQEWLLQRYWEQMRDPVLVPSFKKMLAARSDSKNVREAALKGLMELAPDEARSFIIAEIRDPRSFVDPKLLGQLKDEYLPEVDAVFLEQIRRLTDPANPHAAMFLGFKTALLVRFATSNIYQDLMRLYQDRGPQLTNEIRASLLAYFAKHNEREAIPLIEQAISELKPGAYSSFLSGITSLYYSESIGALLKKILETDDLELASYAAYLLGRHGSAGDEQILEARLKRWREQWRDRVAEADAQQQGRIERELIFALINGNSWKLPPDRVRELQTSCVTQLCKQNNPVRQ